MASVNKGTSSKGNRRGRTKVEVKESGSKQEKSTEKVSAARVRQTKDADSQQKQKSAGRRE